MSEANPGRGADALRGRVRRVSEVAVAGDHEELPAQPIFAAPASPRESNRIRSSLFPRACFKLEDTVFQFDSSFPLFGQSFDADPLKAILDENRGARLSIFGHADPSGDDDYNKVLSGRRAQSIHAMLIRDTAVWRKLYVEHDARGKDKWGLRSVQIMLNVVGSAESQPDGSGVRIDGAMDEPTREKLRAFQDGRGLPPAPFGPAPEHRVDAASFAVLAEKYMDVLCLTDAAGNTLRLTKQDFLAQGEGKDGKGDLQGCSEFNPILVFSRQENQALQREENRGRRNDLNRPNRRVMVLVFRPGSRVDPEKWPCPTVKEGVAACRKRFFKKVSGADFQDGDARRAPQDARRKFETSQDTFACRFYQRLVEASPCERITRQVRIRLFDREGNALAGAPFVATVSGRTTAGFTDANADALVRDVQLPDTCTVRWSRPSASLDRRGRPPDPASKDFEFAHAIFIDVDDQEVVAGAEGGALSPEAGRRRLHNLGYAHGQTPDENVSRFQEDVGQARTGVLADAEPLLREHHDGSKQPPRREI